MIVKFLSIKDKQKIPISPNESKSPEKKWGTSCTGSSNCGVMFQKTWPSLRTISSQTISWEWYPACVCVELRKHTNYTSFLGTFLSPVPMPPSTLLTSLTTTHSRFHLDFLREKRGSESARVACCGARAHPRLPGDRKTQNELARESRVSVTRKGSRKSKSMALREETGQ